MANRFFFDGAQIEIESLPIQAISAAQTIILNKLESTAQTFNPTVVLNTPFTITLNRLESSAQVYLPTVILAGGTQTITLDRLESTAQVFLPTITQVGGVQTITLNLLGSTAQVFLPAIQLIGAVTDTSDILDRYRRSRSESKEEENVAAQLLKARQKRPQVRKEYKEVLNWKKLIYAAIYGAETLEQLDGIKTSSIPNTSPKTTRAVLAEVEQAKAARRLELKLKMEEASLQAFQLENQISAKIEEQRQAVEAIRQLQKEIVAKHQIAVKTAEEAYKQSLLEFQVAEEKAAEFTRKRNNRIKRIKALMWLAKLDI
jgi:hypothetical protein